MISRERCGSEELREEVEPGRTATSRETQACRSNNYDESFESDIARSDSSLWQRRSWQVSES
jgi:hypothetical protein